MSFFKSLFGLGGGDGPAPQKTIKKVEHNGYEIEAQPYAEGGQFQVAGVVSKIVDGSRREHRFVRADRFATIEDAANIALLKGQQLVDQQGDRMFG